MEGKHLILSVSSIPPYVQYTLNGDAIVLQGCFGQLWTILEERLGFTSEYIIESYSAGVSNFQNKRRDVLFRPSVILSNDFDKVDFTFPIGSTWYELYIKDSDEINSSNSYIRNWSVDIWIFTCLMIFFFTVLLYLMLYFSHKFSLRNIYIVPAYESTFQIVQYYSNDNLKYTLPTDWRRKKTEYQKLKNKNERSLGNCFIVALAVFCSQGVYLHTNINSVRILLLSFLIFGMIMYNAYSALLVSQLTLGERFLPFDTLEGIPTKGQGYSLCIRPESYPYSYFTVNNSNVEIIKKWKNIVNRKPCPDDGILSVDGICEPYIAFLESPPVMNQYFQKNINCKMTNLKGRYFDVNFSLMLLKGFEDKAKRELNKEILKYREKGILSYLKEKWIRHEKNTQGTGNQRTQVTFEHIEGVLLVYIISVGVSCFIFFIEIFTFFTTKRKFTQLKRTKFSM